MTIDEALKKADENSMRIFWNDSRDFLDPSFWQSLGKAMGWKPVHETCGSEMSLLHGDSHCVVCREDTSEYQAWLYHWHRFIDHLAEGKSAESFFEKMR